MSRITNDLSLTQAAELQNIENHGHRFDFFPSRIFVNHIDSYHGKKLIEALTSNEGQKSSETSSFGELELHSPPKNVDRGKIEVIGTVKDVEYKKPEDVTKVFRPNADGTKAPLNELIVCGTVIYDITHDDSQINEALWALEGIVNYLEDLRRDLPKEFELNRHTRRFVLISTVMTWALTKAPNPEDPDAPLIEANFRKRKPHPNFKDHVRCEREVSTIAKRTKLDDRLKIVIVGSGITYGDEEGPLEYLFKMGWQNADYLPIFGRGNNKIPLIHVRDLVECVRSILNTWPKPKYIVAVEPELVTQATIVKKISKALTSGKVKHLGMEEAFLLPDVTQRCYDMMNVDINIEPAWMADNEILRDTTFRDNVRDLIKEYMLSRNFAPVKIVVLGPPASGKTKMARDLAEAYEIPHINVKDLIGKTIDELMTKTEDASEVAEQDGDEEKVSEGGDDEDEDEDETDDDEIASREFDEELRIQLDEFLNNRTDNNERFDDDILNKIVLRRLLSKECQLHGYVIDGYPKTLAQAKGLFGRGDNDDDEEDDENEDDDNNDDFTNRVNRKTIPHLVISIEANDEFLIERVVKMSEKDIQGTHYNEEGMLRRLREYRERNTDDESPLDFFNEHEIQVFVMKIDDDQGWDTFATLAKCFELLGEPRVYEPSAIEREEKRKREDAAAEIALKNEEARRAREDLERKLAREDKMKEWTDLLEKLTREEAERLKIAAEPLRHYLVRYIFPTLSQGLVEVAKLRPEDPIDFLAEYLFKANPNGKMFEPDYTETMSELLAAIENTKPEIVTKSELNEGMTDGYAKSPNRPNERPLSTKNGRENDDDDRTETNPNEWSTFSNEAVVTSDESVKRGRWETDASRGASSFSYEDVDGAKSFDNSRNSSQENFQ